MPDDPLCWPGLQDAGFAEPRDLPTRCGVFVCGGSLPHLRADLDDLRSHAPVEYWEAEIGHDKDYLAGVP